MIFNKEIFEKNLKTKVFGTYSTLLETVNSTNVYAQQLVKQGAPEGTVVIADFQQAGQGRYSRKWESESGKNILLSIVLKPSLSVERINRITLAVAVILVNSLIMYLRQLNLELSDMYVKWPNDIIFNQRKLAGILTESSLCEKKVEYVIVGIGVNVNQDISRLSRETAETATSLKNEYKIEFCREELAAAILNQFESTYFQYERTNYQNLIKDWRKHSFQIKTKIRVKTRLTEEIGIFKDIDDDGVLLYENKHGETKKLISGEVYQI